MRNVNIQENFFEKQRGIVWWMHLIMGFVLGKILYKSVVNHGIMSFFLSNERIIALIIVLLVWTLISIISLKTVINEYGVFVKMFPFMWKFKLYSWENIAEFKVEKYNPLIDTGGWGYRFGYNFFFNKRTITTYNLSGNIALKLLLKNGRRVWIGTKQGAKMREFLENLLQQMHNLRK
jgi:hypothetical protein